MKKLLAVLLTITLILTMAACSKGIKTDYSGATISGKVTAVNSTKVTLKLGTSGGGGSMGQPPEKPSDNNSGTQSANASDGQPQSGDTSANGQQGNGSNQPPEKPNDNNSGTRSASSSDSQSQGGETSANGQQGNTSNQPPEKPSGDNSNGGTPPDMQGGGSFTENGATVTVDLKNAEITKDSETVTVSDIAVDDILTITFDDNGKAAKAEISTQSSAQGGGSSTVTQGSSANTIDYDSSVSETTYTSTGDDENALRVDGATVTLDGITVDKSAGSTSNTENGDFYGVNAALLATNGATVTVKNVTVTSSAQNGNGVFSYGSGTTVNISDSTITTTKDNSGGIQTTGGGTTNAENLTVETSGNSSAAIRSDRGGGTVNVDKGSYTSNGYNSPAVYSTAAITVKNATLTANNSEVLVIEGKNSITLENCTVSGNMSDTKGSSSSENVHNVMIYQSMSGDADVGTSEFTMTGGTLTSNNGDMFYVTNTHSVIKLSGVTIDNKDSDSYLMNVCGNSASHGWGTAGKNGAQVEFTADSQELNGDIVVDTISTLNITLKNGSIFTGTLNIVDNAAGGEVVSDNAVVTIDSGCTWKLTGDCKITSVENNGTIDFNGYTITLADGTVLK